MILRWFSPGLSRGAQAKEWSKPDDQGIAVAKDSGSENDIISSEAGEDISKEDDVWKDIKEAKKEVFHEET